MAQTKKVTNTKASSTASALAAGGKVVRRHQALPGLATTPEPFQKKSYGAKRHGKSGKFSSRRAPAPTKPRAPESLLPRSAHINPIPVWTEWYRKIITLRTVSTPPWRHPLGPADYFVRMAALQQSAVATADMAVKTAAFWKMENLSWRFLKQAQPGQTLHDPALSVESCPIAHCGIGIAAVEIAHFNPTRLAAVIRAFSHPDYQLFAYESVGVMLALHEPDLFRVVLKMCDALRRLVFMPLERPSTGPFLQAFPHRSRRLIAHGYGRMLYFKHNCLVSAIRAALRAAPLDVAMAVRGVAFAYAMANNSDLTRVFRAAQNLAPANLRHPFEDGLIYALEFWEWTAPGFLRTLATGLPAAAPWIAAAQKEIDACRARGYLEAFGFIQRSPAYALLT